MLPVLAALFVLIFLVFLRNGTLRRRRLPPGPRRLPIVGNLYELPLLEAWKYHGTETLRKFGDVAYMEALGRPLVVLNSYSAAHDLFIKRSSLYSDRPRLPVAGELMGTNKTTVLIPYGASWRTHRRLWHQHFGPKAVEQYHTVIQAESKALVMRLLEKDRNVCSQLKLWVVKALLGAVFGIKVNSLEDELVKFTEEAAHEAGDSVTPGKYLADIIPLLAHIPEWFPGAGWKRVCFAARDRFIKMCDLPYDYTKAAVLSGGATPTFVSSMMEDDSADEFTKKWVSGSAYGAGVHTTLAVITRFIIVMMMHPEIQRQAQQEIDGITAGDRLPTVEDKSLLPYVNALIQELLRWGAVVPLAVPHKLIQDDEYRGYTIPRGSMMIPNLWRISRDPEQYEDPEEFRPERFLKGGHHDQPMDPRLYCFGIGRRICPGRHFAEISLYMSIVTLLATSTISKPLDGNGEEHMPKITFIGQMVSEPELFEARIRPRFAHGVELLRESLSSEKIQ